MKNRIQLFIIIVLMSLVSMSIYAQESGEFKLFKSKTYVKNPLDLRDPFKRRINKKKSNAKKSSIDKSEFTNFNLSLDGKSIDSLQVIGVIVGAERRAMVRVANDPAGPGNIYYIKEGMKVGENGAEVKAILPGGVVLVEKIRNVYDQDEYLETILPLSE
jgi:Tfp pilus assembly protein PilP